MFEQETFERKTFEEKIFDNKDFPRKFATQTLTPKPENLLVSGSRARSPEDFGQRRLMLAALGLLLVALSFVFYRDRDFWFPEGQEAELIAPRETAPVAIVPTTTGVSLSSSVSSSVSASASAPVASASVSIPATVAEPRPRVASSTSAAPARRAAAALVAPAVSEPPPAVVSNRTVLPPLEVEVVAGDNHKTVRPGTSSVRVDLQPGTRPQRMAQPATRTPEEPSTQIITDATPTSDGSETAASVTSNAAERVQMSADTAEVVAHPVSPGYPMLARQMKVQGSVILRALISKDGSIQDLHLLSGPHILAAAAQDAVRQWRFKPHYVDDQAVETQAKITVNFTISTN
jgi:periplasmic protein TonB